MNFSDVLAGTRPLDDGFAVIVPEAWQQGRTAYGGFSTTLALQSALRLGGDLPPLRSASVNFIGPLTGEIEVRARQLRRGKNATWVTTEITREGETGLIATFAFMGAVDSAIHVNDRPVPAGLIPADAAEALPRHPLMPVFLREQFEVRFALPRAEVKVPEICWWVRLTEGAELDPMTALMLVADCLPPGVMPLLDARAPASSMIWQTSLLTPAPSTREGWWLLRSAADYAENGCSCQRMDVWNADGEPVMAGIQSVAVFG